LQGLLNDFKKSFPGQFELNDQLIVTFCKVNYWTFFYN